MPDPVLVGRDENKLKNLCALSGITKMSTDLDAVLADAGNIIYFDAQTTTRRSNAVKKKAVAAGKHIYCENRLQLTLMKRWGCTIFVRMQA